MNEFCMRDLLYARHQQPICSLPRRAGGGWGGGQLGLNIREGNYGDYVIM